MSDMELTEAEKAFDAFVASRRKQGRVTYGQGLDHRDARWDWSRMVLEEMVDACQYLVAENLRLRDALEAALELHKGDPEWSAGTTGGKSMQIARVGAWELTVVNEDWFWSWRVGFPGRPALVQDTADTAHGAKALALRFILQRIEAANEPK